jgi:hypothetical protein
MILYFYIASSATIAIGIAVCMMMLERIKRLERFFNRHENRIRSIEDDLLRLASTQKYIAEGLSETITIVSQQTEAIADHAKALDARFESREVVQ